MLRRDLLLGALGLGFLRRRRCRDSHPVPPKAHKWSEIGVWHDTGVKLTKAEAKAHPPPPIDEAEMVHKGEYQFWAASPEYPRKYKTWLFMRLIGGAEA